jgi:predicted RNA binding protein YcfA (HicA-like mRNA interferase family)
LRAGKGDHEIWTSPGSDRPIVVDGKIMSRHTANAILKQAGIKRKL